MAGIAGPPQCGVVSSALLDGFEQLRPPDQQLICHCIAAAKLPEDRAARTQQRAAAAAYEQPQHPAASPVALLAVVASLLLLLDCLLPGVAVLERAGKLARQGGRRRIYTAINLARTARLRLRWRCFGWRPAFGASEIAPGLFLGSMADAHNLEALRARGIVAIVTVSPGIDPPFEAAGLQYLCLDVIDLPNEQLRSHFHHAAAFVDGVLGTDELPHPYAGVDELWRGLHFAYPETFQTDEATRPTSWVPESAKCVSEREYQQGYRRDFRRGFAEVAAQTEATAARAVRTSGLGRQGRSRSRSPSRLAGGDEQQPPQGQSLTLRPAVLIHCVHGTSRSASVMCAVLLHRRLSTGSSSRGNRTPGGCGRSSGWGLCAGVLEIVKLGRPSAQPNAGFLEQLCAFHEELDEADGLPG